MATRSEILHGHQCILAWLALEKEGKIPERYIDKLKFARDLRDSALAFVEEPKPAVIEKTVDGWLVPSESNPRFNHIIKHIHGRWYCSCPARVECKHVRLIKKHLEDLGS